MNIATIIGFIASFTLAFVGMGDSVIFLDIRSLIFAATPGTISML